MWVHMCAIWIHLCDLDLKGQFGYVGPMWIHMYNLDLKVRFGYVGTMWTGVYNLDMWVLGPHTHVDTEDLIPCGRGGGSTNHWHCFGSNGCYDALF